MKAALQRCGWCGSDPLYVSYHDTEWGVPVHDDRRLFEFLILEGAQAGLSWITILRKREAYRRAFAGFDAEKVARYGERQVARLLADPGIVRNRLKIEAAINNARRFIEVQEAFGRFDDYVWRFVDGRPIVIDSVRQAEALGFRFSAALADAQVGLRVILTDGNNQFLNVGNRLFVSAHFIKGIHLSVADGEDWFNLQQRANQP